MSLRHVCSGSMAGGLATGYIIRPFVAASRAELRSGIVSSRPLKPVALSYTPWRLSAGHTRCYSSKPDVEVSDTPQPSDESSSRELQTSTDAFEQLEAQTEDPIATESTSSSAPEPQTEQSTSPSSSLPWYLQVSPPPSSPSPLSSRQTVPPPPANPPPLLAPLQTYLSLDLGIDDLSLLDLRHLDPPPALGANLLMLLGTARSEKHLHVSADRLCRWLRSEHRLTPFADGLVGRNELKLRAKRKARRAKLLSAVGGNATARGGDDGLRTGWVCVNVGYVQGGVIESGEAKPEFVGFGQAETGCRVVVQMMTDEKRGALDLESLWAGMLNRSSAAAAAAKDDTVLDGGSELERVSSAARSQLDRRTSTGPKKSSYKSPFPEAEMITS
ncbi:hypothetical protein ANO11243_030050 [Dothideomycetidae sp. 11243]|nr:hypothetical protein ANO11243_030050 [fungal sp. No.11243]